ncbi:MAG: bifunctional glutamate N-acetyltransferase/amino-acid acetyltransferase ArgJ [Clostridiales bacterium]
MINKEGLSAVKGYKFSGITVDNSKKNLGLIYSDSEKTYGTAVYTRSDIVAAPVIFSKEMDEKTKIKRAILINSGKANAFTGNQGIVDARECAYEISKILNIDIEKCYIGSTGVIGRKLNVEEIKTSMDVLVESLSNKGNDDFAEAIMTTDTRKKQASVKFEIDGKEINIGACAKGSGMIMPNMATMLCTVLTDASIKYDLLKMALKKAVKETFNCISVDGDTSTNDTVFMLANGKAGNESINKKDKNYKIFFSNLKKLLEHMAKEIAYDGEGATKFITIDVVNTKSRKKAKKVGFSIANSPLVKTAFYGEDMNWGRILMAIGKSMTGMNCNIIDIYVNGNIIVKNGEPQIGQKEYIEAEKSLKNKEISLLIDFKNGNSKIKIWTCDFSNEYVNINALYTT